MSKINRVEETFLVEVGTPEVRVVDLRGSDAVGFASLFVALSTTGGTLEISCKPNFGDGEVMLPDWTASEDILITGADGSSGIDSDGRLAYNLFSEIDILCSSIVLTFTATTADVTVDSIISKQ